jgi:hypothetical protein
MAWVIGGKVYTFRKKLTIDHTKVTSTLTNFPVAVVLTSSRLNFNHTTSTGNDVRFTSSDGKTLLNFERERHNQGSSLAEYWVKIPSISSSTDTLFYIYYAPISGYADGSAATSVWDSSYLGVWHLNNNSTSATGILDSTSNARTSTEVTINGAGSDPNAAGKIGKCVQFDGSNDYLAFGDVCDPDSGDYTAECWAKFDTGSSTFRLMNKRGTGALTSQVGWMISGVSSGGEESFSNTLIDTGTATHYARLNAGTDYNYLDSAWHYYALTWINSTGTLKMYMDGSLKETGTKTGTPEGKSYNATRALSFGAAWDSSSTQSQFFDGYLDECRISNLDRGVAWIAASYYSGNDSLLAYGAEEFSSAAILTGSSF